MTPEHAKAAADLVATMWESEFPATCQVLAAVKDDARDYKPDPKSRTAWELAIHLATADVWFMESIANGAFVWNPEAAKAAAARFENVAGLVAFYKKAFPEKIATLRAVPAEQMIEVLDFFGFLKMPRAQFVAFASNHSIHHRGQLAAYLRAMGSRVPNIYGPSADAEVAAK
jgi:uncharacterized damage-inducible protein DinB